jgi:biotin carboxylase
MPPTPATRVLLCFPATSYRPGAWVSAAERLGIELVLATDLPAAVRRFGCPVVRVSFDDEAASLAALADVEVTAVAAVDEASAALASVFAEARGLPPYHTPAGVRAARDKRIMRRVLRDAGVPVPEFATVVPGAEPPAMLLPWVVKPPMLSGSQGVIRVDAAAELPATAARIQRILDRHPSALSAEPGFRELIVERYVPGPEIAVEALVAAGTLEVLAVFDKPDPLEGPYFEETLYVTPSRHPKDVIAEAIEVVQRSVRALELTDGPVHAELRLAPEGALGAGKPRGPVVLEIAARSIGGLCAQTLFHALGGDAGPGSLEALLLERAMGRRVERPAPSQASGVMMLPVPRSGVLVAVHGLDAARAGDGVDRIDIAIAPGQAVRALPEGRSYLGFAFAHGDTPAVVEAALRRAHGELSFEFKRLLASY